LHGIAGTKVVPLDESPFHTPPKSLAEGPLDNLMNKHSTG